MIVARVNLLLGLSTSTKITVLSSLERFMLLDGHHRAAQFWKTADADFTLAVYVPVKQGPSWPLRPHF